MRAYVERSFGPVAEQKGLEFRVDVADAVARRTMATDEQRLQQILKNLLSNAFKFTHEGTVSLRIALAPPNTRFRNDALLAEETVVAFAVSDTGIGIPEDKLKLIFEAFQQADGTTSRRYGGTGLGLSISREIARLIGGEIQVESSVGKGSTFTLYLPVSHQPEPEPEPAGRAERRSAHARAARVPTAGSRPRVCPRAAAGASRRPRGDRSGRPCRPDRRGRPRLRLHGARGGAERGFKGIIALRGDVGLALAHEYKPDAIVLDMQLPGLDGWAVLDHLKRHPDTRHIPVHVVTGANNGRQHALRAGAVAFLAKPIEKEHLEETFAQMSSFLERDIRNLLVVDDDKTQRKAIGELLGDGDDVRVTSVGSSEEALAELERRTFDCMVLDLKLPKMQGFQLLEQVKTDPRFSNLPVIIYTGKQLTRTDETKLQRFAETIIVKDVRSPERLLDETSLFLHRVESRLPTEKRKLLRATAQRRRDLRGEARPDRR